MDGSNRREEAIKIVVAILNEMIDLPWPSDDVTVLAYEVPGTAREIVDRLSLLGV